MKTLLLIIICIPFTFICCAINRHNNGDSNIIQYKYPEFLYVEEWGEGLNITLYNYHDESKLFIVEPFIPSKGNFGKSTFYVKKENYSDSPQLEEYFRIKRNLWRKIEWNANGQTYQQVRVSNNIAISDTILIIDRLNYDETFRVNDYFEIK